MIVARSYSEYEAVRTGCEGERICDRGSKVQKKFLEELERRKS